MKLIFADIEPGGRLKLQAFGSDGTPYRLKQLDGVENITPLYSDVIAGLPSLFKITNYHFSDSYEVSTENGTVSITDNIVTYIAETEGLGGFRLNGYLHEAWVTANEPGTPVLVHPRNGMEDLPQDTVLVSSGFFAPNPLMVHVKTHWQVARDPEFQDLVMDVDSETHLLQIPIQGVEEGGVYYVRLAHTGEIPD